MKRFMILTIVIIGVLLLALPTLAQDGADVSADEVNDVASRLFCPVCENIPLDTCGTAACEDWRNEIRLYLADGMTEDQIIDDFVMRFGERVVGVPRNPVLNVLALIAPLAVLIIVGVVLFRAFVTGSGKSEKAKPEIADGDAFRDMLEKDLAGGQ